MATHSSVLAWRILWTEEPGGLQSMGSRRVRHDFTFTFHFHALEKEMATHSAFLPGKSYGQRSLAGYNPWGHKEFVMTEATEHIVLWASLVAQLVKNLPAMQETWVQSLGWEDLLEKGTATHSSILAWRIPWDLKESDVTE